MLLQKVDKDLFLLLQEVEFATGTFSVIGFPIFKSKDTLNLKETTSKYIEDLKIKGTVLDTSFKLFASDPWMSQEYEKTVYVKVEDCDVEQAGLIKVKADLEEVRKMMSETKKIDCNVNAFVSGFQLSKGLLINK